MPLLVKLFTNGVGYRARLHVGRHELGKAVWVDAVLLKHAGYAFVQVLN